MQRERADLGVAGAGEGGEEVLREGDGGGAEGAGEEERGGVLEDECGGWCGWLCGGGWRGQEEADCCLGAGGVAGEKEGDGKGSDEGGGGGGGGGVRVGEGWEAGFARFMRHIWFGAMIVASYGEL